jgi:hypothetical protein
VTLPKLSVFVAAPEAFVPRAAWVLQTILAPLGRQAAVTRDPGAAGTAALAYAPAPVPGVPTLACDAGAMELFAGTRPLPAGAFAARAGRRRHGRRRLARRSGRRLCRPVRPRGLGVHTALLLGRTHVRRA